MSRYERRAVGSDLVVTDTKTGRSLRYTGVLATGRRAIEHRTVTHRSGFPQPLPAEVRSVSDSPLPLAEVVGRGVTQLAAEDNARRGFARRLLGGAR